MKKPIAISVNRFSTIKEVLQIIDKGALRIAVVQNDKNEVIGTITDGDIRRGLLNGLSLDATIETIYNKNPITCNQNKSEQEMVTQAIKNRVYQIPIVDDENKLIDIKDIANMLDAVKRPNKVILMAGGLGTRLQPLTNDIPKPLLKVGSTPILETIIRNFSKNGFKDIIISVNYKSEMIKDYFGDGSKFGVTISYIDENKRMGTAGALSLLQDKPNESFFVMNGDLLTNVDFSKLLDFHSLGNADATMAVREYDFQVPYGVVQTKGDKVIDIVEKPIHKFFVNAGIYLLSPKVLEYIPKDEFYDMPSLFEKLIEENRVTLSFPIHEYWLDIGRISDFEKANIEYSKVF